VRRGREQWRKTHFGGDVRRLVFLDETGVNTRMTRLYGRSARGERCVCAVPQGHWVSYTVVCALRQDRLCAARVIEGAMRGERFAHWVRRALLPCLRRGDTVVCDNLSAHKCAAARELIEARGCKLCFLPPYSPDLNPIEQANSKLKSDLRREEAREHAALVAAVRKSVRHFSPEMCRNFFSHAGYVST
jgi:transposase